MNKSFLILCLFSFSIGLTACSMSETNDSNEMNQEESQTGDSIQETGDTEVSNSSTLIDINIVIGGEEFSAKLYDNETTQAFIEKLPLDINMSDVNSNEKFYRFSEPLPTDAERPGEINAGDIMLFRDNGLVVFYETFSSNYSYTRIGYMEEATDLAETLGAGDVEVSFALAEDRG